MKRVLCLLADGFEEIEFTTPVDLLRRAGVEVVVAAIDDIQATGRSGIRVIADVNLTDECEGDFDLLFIPGGPGVGELRRDGRAANMARAFHASGKPVAAICAAPLVLHDAGLLDGRKFTAHRSVTGQLAGALNERVVEDGNLITSRGAGTAIDFALVLVARLTDQDTAEKIAADIMA
jgi:4-methyl-5(b-hydroxyethyl)-thiazole monophosphate biosynthesis